MKRNELTRPMSLQEVARTIIGAAVFLAIGLLLYAALAS